MNTELHMAMVLIECDPKDKLDPDINNDMNTITRNVDGFDARHFIPIWRKSIQIKCATRLEAKAEQGEEQNDHENKRKGT